MLDCYQGLIHFSFHPAWSTPLRVAKNGFRRSVNREMNRPKAANRPVSYCTPFLEMGAGEYRIALSCAGFSSIPLCVTMKPKNRPTLTLKAHFKGLSFIPYALRRSKASCRCVVWFGRSFDFTSILSIYTSMVLPSNGLNILVTSL